MKILPCLMFTSFVNLYLSVIDQVDREDESANTSIYHLHVPGKEVALSNWVQQALAILVLWDKDHDDAKDEEDKHNTHQNTSHHGEVPLGLQIWI